MSSVHEVLFSEGEGVEPDDFNNAQRFLRAQVNDLLVRARMRASENAMVLDACFGLGVGGHIDVTATALRSTNDAGVIAQLVDPSAMDGEEPRALVYHLAADELLTNHAAAHATLDRWDIVCVKLEHVEGDSESRDFKDATTGLLTSTTPNKRRSVTLTKQVVAGVDAAAGSAVEPAVPAGYVKWAAVLIPAAHAGVFVALTHFRDYRVPVGHWSTGTIMAPAWFRPSGGFATANNMNCAAAGAGEAAYCILPISEAARVMRVTFHGKITAGGEVNLYLLTGFTGTGAGALDVIHGPITTAGVYGVHDFVFEGLSSTDALPVWGRGAAGGPAANASPTQFLLLTAVSGAAGDYVNFVNFEVAGS